MKTLVGLVCAALVASSAPAAAEWVYEGNSGTFDGPLLQIVATTNFTYSLGLRCRAGDRLEIVYITQDDSVKGELIEKANRLEPLLRVRVDTAPIRDFPTRFEERAGGFIAVSKVDRELLLTIRDARRRVAIALFFAGKHHHDSVFSASGSTQAIQKLIAGCQLK